MVVEGRLRGGPVKLHGQEDAVPSRISQAWWKGASIGVWLEQPRVTMCKSGDPD